MVVVYTPFRLICLATIGVCVFCALTSVGAFFVCEMFWLLGALPFIRTLENAKKEKRMEEIKLSKRLQGMIAGLLAGVLLTGGTIFAKKSNETIEAFYNDIKIYVDGIMIDPKDASGEKIEPFIYNGTTYLPVRAVGEAFGKKVDWDGETKSVYIGEKPGEKTYLIDVCPAYKYNNCDFFNSANGKSFLMGGHKYTNGFTLNNWGWNCGEVYFNLNAQYKTVTFDMGPIDGTNYSITNARSSRGDTVVSIYVDDKLLADYTLKNGDLPQKITLPVNYGMKLRITHDVRDGSVGFGNIIAE